MLLLLGVLVVTTNGNFSGYNLNMAINGNLLVLGACLFWELSSEGLIYHEGRRNHYRYFITGAGRLYLTDYLRVSRFKELVKEVAQI